MLFNQTFLYIPMCIRIHISHHPRGTFCSYRYLFTAIFCLLQAAAVREGMARIIPVPLLSLLTAKSLEQLVCGMETIDVDVLKKVVR